MINQRNIADLEAWTEHETASIVRKATWVTCGLQAGCSFPQETHDYELDPDGSAQLPYPGIRVSLPGGFDQVLIPNRMFFDLQIKVESERRKKTEFIAQSLDHELLKNLKAFNDMIRAS